MEKEKILQRYRQEGVDEGREEVNRRGDDAGFYAMCVLALLLMIYQAFTGQVFGDVAAMLFVPTLLYVRTRCDVRYGSKPPSEGILQTGLRYQFHIPVRSEPGFLWILHTHNLLHCNQLPELRLS